MNRTHFEAVREKKQAVREAEAAGVVADSHAVRLAIMKRVHAGEITLEQAQAELARIKRGAAARGMRTRAQAFDEG